MLTKKGISPLKYVYMISLIGILFISFVIIFYNLTTITLNEKSLQHQLIEDSIIKDCYSGDFIGKYRVEQFTKEYFSNCIDFKDNEYTARIILETKNENSLATNPTRTHLIEIGEKNFQREQQFCSIYSTKHCTEAIHKVLIEENESLKNAILRIEIIS